MIMKQLLIMMIGRPGSGKSHFAKQLAPKLGAVRLNGDHARISLFADPAELANPANNPFVFGALDYAAYEILKAGYGVVYDAQMNYLDYRNKNRELAAQFDTPAVLVWVQAPYDSASLLTVLRHLMSNTAALTLC